MSKTSPAVFGPDNMEFTPRFAYGDQAQVAVVCGADGQTELGSGYVRLTDAKIPWTIKYDEVVLVIEGEITIRTGERDLVARAGQSIWLPAGTDLTYVAENALVFYAIHPANWAGD